jgi:hypothetical protein
MNKNASNGSTRWDGRTARNGGTVPASDADVGRKALWVIRELSLPAIIKACVSCRTSTRHHPSGKFRVNANGKLLDVWLLVCCGHCGRTSKIPVHERVHVRTFESSRLRMFEDNDPAAVRELVMSTTLARKGMYRLDWSGTWTLETDMPFYSLEDPVPINVVVRFELPAPIRVEKILMLGFGISRSQLRSAVASGRVRLPLDTDAKVSDDFALTVMGMEAPGAVGAV